MPASTPQSIRFGDGFELDPGAYKLRRAGRVLKLERIPMEVLLFLAVQPGELVTREQIVERVWGKDIFLDTDNSINGAIRKIRQVLKDDPEDPKFIQTVTGKGYRFIAQTAERPPAILLPQVPVLLEHTGTPDNAAIRRYRPWHFVAATAAVLLLVAAGVYLLRFRSSTRSAAPPSPRVMLAVLPFTNLTGDASQEYFSDGLTEEMISELGQLNPERLGVIGRTSVMLYKNNPKALDKVGRELGVQYVIEGSVRRDSDHVRITAQLIQVKDQTHVWARQYDRELKNLLAVQAEIAAEIKDELQLTLGWQTQNASPSQRPTTTPTSYEAYDLYLRGRYFWNQRTPASLLRAADFFQQAVRKDPAYAQAYSGLADTFALMSTWHQVPQNEFMPKARAAALKALEIDDTLAEAHTSMALIAESYDYDWDRAEKEFRRAIELNPYYATAHQWYGEFLGWQGRFAEAEAESERARQLDPLSLIIAIDHASIDYFSRQYDRAIERARAVLEMDPNFADRGIIANSLIQQRKFPEALDEVDRAYSSNISETWAWKANIYGQWGRMPEARQALERAQEFVSSDRSSPSTVLLESYIGMGKKDQAIAILQEAYAKHSNVVLALKVEPAYDPLRSDPRFQDLLRRLRLE